MQRASLTSSILSLLVGMVWQKNKLHSITSCDVNGWVHFGSWGQVSNIAKVFVCFLNESRLQRPLSLFIETVLVIASFSMDIAELWWYHLYRFRCAAIIFNTAAIDGVCASWVQISFFCSERNAPKNVWRDTSSGFALSVIGWREISHSFYKME